MGREGDGSGGAHATIWAKSEKCYGCFVWEAGCILCGWEGRHDPFLNKSRGQKTCHQTLKQPCIVPPVPQVLLSVSSSNLFISQPPLSSFMSHWTLLFHFERWPWVKKRGQAVLSCPLTYFHFLFKIYSFFHEDVWHQITWNSIKTVSRRNCSWQFLCWWSCIMRTHFTLHLSWLGFQYSEWMKNNCSWWKHI